MNLLNAIKTVRLFKKQEELIPLKTKWSQQLDPNHVLEDYPRPQMKRDNYINLNGFYHYAINQKSHIFFKVKSSSPFLQKVNCHKFKNNCYQVIIYGMRESYHL